MAGRWITIVFLFLYQAGFLLANLALNCTPEGQKNVKPQDHSLIHNEILSADRDTWTTYFVQPGDDFRGISVMVKNQAIEPTWFSMQQCFPDDREWMKIKIRMTKKNIAASYGRVTVTTDRCRWACNIATIRLPRRNVNLFLLAHGSSTWQRSLSPQCHNTTDSDLQPKTYYSCKLKTKAEFKIDTSLVFAGVMVVIVVVMVAVGVRKMMVRRYLRRTTTPSTGPAPQMPVQTHFPYPTNNVQPPSYHAMQPVNTGHPRIWAPTPSQPYPPLEALGERRAPRRYNQGFVSPNLDEIHLGAN